MARSYTLAQLRTAAKRRADMENSTFVSDVEWNTYISASYGELYALLVNSGFDFFESTQTITTDGTNASYALPADFGWCKGVDYVLDSQRKIDLALLQYHERNLFPVSAGKAIAYRVAGSNVTLYPRPPSGQSYILNYIPVPADLTTDGQTVDGVSGWEELIVLDAAIKALSKEESDTTHLERERERIRKRIQDESSMREINNPKRVVDVTQTLNNAELNGDPANWRYWR